MATNTNITLSNIDHRAMDINLLAKAVEYTKNTKIAVGNTNTSVLAANPNRRFAVFTNDSDTVIYLSLGSTAVINEGIRLNVATNGGSYKIDVTNLYNGAISAIASSGSKNLCVAEGYDKTTHNPTLRSDAEIT